MNKTRLFARLLVSPFILGIFIISYSLGCLKQFVNYIRYGGEWMVYTKEDPKRMAAIWKLLKECDN